MDVTLVLITLASIGALAILMLVAVNASRTPPTAKRATIDWAALADEELQSYLPDQKIRAIKRYRELTRATLRDAKDAVDYLIAHPEALEKAKHDRLHGASARLADTGGAGVRDLIAEGRTEQAVRVYAEFMGVDEFTARAAVERMEGEG